MRVRLALTFSLLVGVLFAYDFIRFYQFCQSYSNQAENRVLPSEGLETEAIVVLTGDKRRIPKALELLRVRKSPWLIISGTGRGTSLVSVLNSQGDSARNIHEHWNKIVAESRSQSTIENVYESGKILYEKKMTRAIVVTSDYHMPRAMKLFRRLLPDIEVISYPVLSDFSAGDAQANYLTGIWNVIIEYWKNRVVDWFRLATLSPLKKS